jgi:hypothetical protein
MVELTECYRREGRRLAPTRVLDLTLKDPLQGELILAPPSLLTTEVASLLGDYETAFASGWMLRDLIVRRKAFSEDL